MSTQVPVTTTREVEVIRIPSGEKILLPAGTEVVITQALGGSYTLLVHTLAGLFRLDGVNADAIGKKKRQRPICQQQRQLGRTSLGNTENLLRS